MQLIDYSSSARSVWGHSVRLSMEFRGCCSLQEFYSAGLCRILTRSSGSLIRNPQQESRRANSPFQRRDGKKVIGTRDGLNRTFRADIGLISLRARSEVRFLRLSLFLTWPSKGRAEKWDRAGGSKSSPVKVAITKELFLLVVQDRHVQKLGPV